MKKNNHNNTLVALITIVLVMAWLSMSYVSSKYCIKWLHESGATMITKDDIMQAYIAPYFLFGVLCFVAWVNIVGRIKP